MNETYFFSSEYSCMFCAITEEFFGYIKQIALYLHYKGKIKENGTIYSYNSRGRYA